VPGTTTGSTIQGDEIAVAPGDDLAALVKNAPPGTHFVLLPGVHRVGEVDPKDNMTFEGRDGAVLDGSQLLEGFATTTDGWDLAGVDLNMERHGECVEGYEACALRNDLYVDDQMLWRVDDRDQLVPGTWWSDGRRVVMADDPTGRKVEISIDEYAFGSSADGVTITNLIIEKYASMAQRGAVQAQAGGQGDRGSNWLIENSEIRLNHGAGIKAGDNTIIRNVHVHHNGQEGITAVGSVDLLVASSELDHNNVRGFNWGWEGAGAKLINTHGLVVRDTIVHDNLGPGLWTDINCYDTTYEDNVVYSNYGPGIFHEISYDAVIRGNEVYDNGFISRDWLWGAGILVAASSGVEVYDNTVTNNADGIAGIQQRRDENGTQYRLENLHVHDNTITMWYGQTGVVEDIGDPTVFTDRNIVFEDNTYIGAGHEAFAWNDADLHWEGWLAAGQGHGSVISNG
jgi:parallel beta-helix repeat protein